MCAQYSAALFGVIGTVVGAVLGAWLSARFSFQFQAKLLQQQLQFQERQAQQEAEYRAQLQRANVEAVEKICKPLKESLSFIELALKTRQPPP